MRRESIMGYDGALCTRTKEEFDRYCNVCDSSSRVERPSMKYRTDDDYSVIDFGSTFRGLFDALKYEDGILTKVEKADEGKGEADKYGFDIPDYDLTVKAFDGLDELCDALESIPIFSDFMTVLKQDGADDDDVVTYWSAIMHATREQREGWDAESPTSCTISDPVEAMRRRADLYRIIDGSGMMPEIAWLVKDNIVTDGPRVLYAVDTFADVGFACRLAKIDTLRLVESW